MVEKKAGLTPLQIEVLEWIKAGQPAGSFGDSEDLTYRSHARWLEKYGLVSISGSGDSWRVKLTARGRKWPEAPARLQPRSAARSGRATATGQPGSRPASRENSPSSDMSSRTSREAVDQTEGSQKRQAQAAPAGSEEALMKYRVQVTRVQVADRWVRASSEEDAAKQALEELRKPHSHQRDWRTTSIDTKILEVEQMKPAQTGVTSEDEPLLLSLEDAARKLGVPKSVVDELISNGEIEWTQVSTSRYISREALYEFINENSKKSHHDEPGTSASQARLPAARPDSGQGNTRSDASGPISAEQSRRTKTADPGPTGKRPPHPGQVLMENFIGSREKLRDVSETTGISGKALQQIAQGKRHISPALAASLGMYFGNGERFWMNLQRRYDAYRQ